MKSLSIATLLALGMGVNIAVADVRAADVKLATSAAADKPAAPAASSSPASPMASIPFRQDQGLGAMALNVGLGLTLAIGAGIAVLYLLRRQLSATHRSAGRRLRVIETVRLSPRSALFLVELDGQTLLVGQQGEGLAVLNPPSAAHPIPPAAHDA